MSLLLVLLFEKYKQNFSFYNLLTLNFRSQTESLKKSSISKTTPFSIQTLNCFTDLLLTSNMVTQNGQAIPYPWKQRWIVSYCAFVFCCYNMLKFVDTLLKGKVYNLIINDRRLSVLSTSLLLYWLSTYEMIEQGASDCLSILNRFD